MTLSGEMNHTEVAAERLLDGAREIAAQAGRRILTFYRQDAQVEQKADASPLTLADRRRTS